MAEGLLNKYGSRATSDPANYPDGKFKNETAIGADNGTPVEADWGNNYEGFFQKLRQAAGVIINGDPDTVQVCQSWQALLADLAPTAPPQATPADICSGMPNTDWSNPAGTPNFLDTGQTIRDSCVGWDDETSQHYLLILEPGATIKKVTGCWEYGANPVLSSALSFNWATEPDDICAICCDSGSLFVAWRETGANIHVSKFDLNPFTGNELWVRDTGYVAMPTTPSVRLCVATAYRIGILINEDLGSSNHAIRIGILQKSSGAFSSDSFAQQTDFVGCRIISDGTYLYAIGRTGTTTYTYVLLRCEVSDVTAQGAFQIEVLTSTSYEQFPTSLQRVRDFIVISDMTGRIWAHEIGSSAIYTLCSQLDIEYFDSGDAYSTAMGSDCQNLFICYGRTGVTPSIQSLYRISNKTLHIGARSSSRVVRADEILVATKSTYSNSMPLAYLLFDRRDLWVVNADGKIYRVCNPGG